MENDQNDQNRGGQQDQENQQGIERQQNQQNRQQGGQNIGQGAEPGRDFDNEAGEEDATNAGQGDDQNR